MAGEDGERLAVVETRLGMLEIDVREIKADVKSLLRSQQGDANRREQQAATGVWVRWLPQIAVAVLALINIYYLLSR